MKNLFFALVVIFLCACQPSQAAIEAAIQQTQAAAPTMTKTIQPSVTPTLEPSATATATINPNACVKANVDPAVETLSDQWQIFLDQWEIVETTSRIALAGPVSRLQEIKRETEAMDFIWCVDQYQEYILKAMDWYTRSIIAFMGQEEDSTVGVMIRVGDGYAADVQAEKARLEETTHE